MADNIGSSNHKGALSEEQLIDLIDFDEDIGNLGDSTTMKFQIGMEFNTHEEVYETYNTYAKKRGFGVRRRTARDNYILLTCSRNGFIKDSKNCDDAEDVGHRSSSLTRCGCKAAISATKDRNSEKWRIHMFFDIHNHEMVTPKSITLLKSHKTYSVAAKNLTEAFSSAGIPIAKVPHVFGSREVPFAARDCYNHLSKVRSIIYEAGNAQAVLVYCNKEREKDPNFYYSIQFDDDSRMTNFFWVDARSRSAYEHFGDAVTFDTTYRTNKYSMPFAPFVGVNHHLQSVMFGCGLLHDETEESFTWLFQTFLSAMKGKSPRGIITDQDPAMAKAIRNVFPGVRHRLCLWHITKKFPEKIGHMYKEGLDFSDDFNKVVYKKKNKDTFEADWNHVISKYHLEDNEWLKGMYAIRHSWIPVLNRGFFWAGMNTTQRSESINAFFNTFVHNSMTLREFVVNYDRGIDSRYESYKREEFDSVHKERRRTLNMPLEEHAASVYTRNIYLKFHEQLTASITLMKQKLDKQGTMSSYRLWDWKDVYNDHVVHIDFSSLQATCTCQKFEFIGILCKHILNIFVSKSVPEIPATYILQRWRKEGNKISSTPRAFRSMEVRSFGLRHKYALLNDLADQSEAAYRFIHEAVDSIMSTAQQIVTDGITDLNSQDTVVGSNPTDYPTDSTLKDPQVSQTKGRKRLKSGLENASKNSNVCGSCGKRGHNRRSCKQSQQ